MLVSTPKKNGKHVQEYEGTQFIPFFSSFATCSLFEENM